LTDKHLGLRRRTEKTPNGMALLSTDLPKRIISQEGWEFNDFLAATGGAGAGFSV
jgi:hypothetical protein